MTLEAADSKSPAALLLRGHVLISFHRFAEAEAIARELVAQRTLPFDYGLLGDALVEQGRLAEAVSAYQRMVDLRPDLQSYSRVAYMRWLKGDLDGAIEVARMAAGAASPLDPESGVVVADPPRALLFPGWLARRRQGGLRLGSEVLTRLSRCAFVAEPHVARR